MRSIGRASLPWKIAIGLFAVLSLSFIFHQIQEFNKNSLARSKVSSKASLGSPVRLTIPAINVNASVQHVGVNSKGDMDVPSNIVDVAWFNLGPRPGEKGSAVIAGHVDGENGEDGVFINLDKLKEGDKLYIEDSSGTSTTFVVRESRTYDPGYAEEVFTLNDSAHLNLITCTGEWDGAKKSFSKRLVVFADITD